MCDCVDVDVGSYANQVTFRIPDHMAEYRMARIRAGLSDSVSVDRCLSGEVQRLWSLGIRTMGCCCGHNKIAPYIEVHEADIGRMVHELGYTRQRNECDPGRRDCFVPKSVTVEVEQAA